MQASDVLVRARIILQDVDGVRWDDAEGFQWLTDGLRTLVLVRPDACVANVQVALVAGSRQTIPVGGLRLLDVVRNVTSNGTGRAIRLTDRSVLDGDDPYWHARAPSATIRHYVYDERNPTVFYVSPPAITPDTHKTPPAAKIEIIYSKQPAVVESMDDDLGIEEIYMDPLLNYVLFRCYSKDAQFVQNAQLAGGYMNTFINMLGVKTKKDVAFSPDMNTKGGQPDGPAIAMEGV